MDRKGYKKNKDNIVPFPNLVDRLLEKGLEQLQQNNFEASISYLEQAHEMSPRMKDIYVGLILAYYESGRLLLARKLAKELVDMSEDDFQALELYIMVLVQMHDYDEIISSLENLTLGDIPEEKRDHIQRIFSLSKKMVGNKGRKEEKRHTHPRLNLLDEVDLNKLALKVSELSYGNIRPYIEEVKEYLQLETGHPFLKTMLLSILIDQEYDKEVLIEKFAKRTSVIPTQLPDLNGMKNKTKIVEALERVQNKDPYLYQQIISLYDRHIFILFPFQWFDDEHANVWAAAYHFVALEYLGMGKSSDKLSEEYEISINSLEEACNFLRKLEEISYPII